MTSSTVGSLPLVQDPDSPAAAARALAGRWRGGDPADGDLLGGCVRELARLRSLWRRRPADFDDATVALLREIAAALVQPSNVAALGVLDSVFGYDSFRPGQQEIIETLLAGRDCVGVMPTGAGKSITYQIPARVLGGTTLVISPLVALMKDQVDAMGEVGMRATYLSATLDPDERQRRWRDLAAAYYVQQISHYPRDYILRDKNLPERVIETVERLQEDFTDKNSIHEPLHATIQVGEAIPVGTQRNRDELGDPIMADVRRQLQGMIDEMAAERTPV